MTLAVGVLAGEARATEPAAPPAPGAAARDSGAVALPATSEPAAADTGAALRPGAPQPGGAPADSGRGLRLVRRTGAPADTARGRVRRGRFDAPRWVMLRSLVVPGWGQLHNGSWFKAAVIGGGEAWIVAGMVEDNRRMKQLKTAADVARAEGDNDGFNAAVDAYNVRLNRFVSREWLLGGLVVYSLMDAYVDAHFRDFKVEFQVDRALKGGKPAGGQARLSLGWAF